MRLRTPQTFYAKSSVVEGVWKVPNDLGDLAAKSVDDFRNKKLFDFGFTEPDKVEVGTYHLHQEWLGSKQQVDVRAHSDGFRRCADL